MKGLLSIIFLAEILAVSPEVLCPKEQEINWEIELLLPHKDCDKFYQCVHGQPIQLLCPKGLYFNIENSLCEWRVNVDCNGRNVVIGSYPDNELDENSQDSISESNEKDTEEKKPNGHGETENPNDLAIEFLPNGCPSNPEIHWLAPHENNCNLFYYCVLGERSLTRCPRWLHFNKKLQVCDWPRNAECVSV